MKFPACGRSVPAVMSNQTVAIVVALGMYGGAAVGAERAPTFERDIQPILTRAGCNAGACHGKARGQNGFALSLLGFDPDVDFHSIVKEAGGGRRFPADSETSRLLRKPAGLAPHGGGKKLPKGSAEYELVRRWIAAGTPRTPNDAPKLVRIAVEPAEIVAAFGQE